jgi:hypothetical protein
MTFLEPFREFVKAQRLPLVLSFVLCLFAPLAFSCAVHAHSHDAAASHDHGQETHAGCSLAHVASHDCEGDELSSPAVVSTKAVAHWPNPGMASSTTMGVLRASDL